MSHSRFRKTARQRVFGRLRPSLKAFLSGFLLLSGVLGTGSPGYGFESFEKFEQSKKQSLALRLEAMPGKDRVHSGETFRLYVVAILEKGWHLYSLEKQSEDETIATRIELETSAFHPQGGWRETPPKLVRDEIMQKVMKIHSGRVEFTHLLSVPEGLPPGVYPLSGILHFRICDNRICTLPRQMPFQTRVIVKAGESG